MCTTAKVSLKGSWSSGLQQEFLKEEYFYFKHNFWTIEEKIWTENVRWAVRFNKGMGNLRNSWGKSLWSSVCTWYTDRLEKREVRRVVLSDVESVAGRLRNGHWQSWITNEFCRHEIQYSRLYCKAYWKRKRHLLLLYSPQLIETSSPWPQLCMPHPRWVHRSMPLSVPTQMTSSSHIWFVPGP